MLRPARDRRDRPGDQPLNHILVPSTFVAAVLTPSSGTAPKGQKQRSLATGATEHSSITCPGYRNYLRWPNLAINARSVPAAAEERAPEQEPAA
jgi:hypothetical protein